MQTTNVSRRNMDKNLLINLICEHGSIARTALHRLTKIRLASITEICREMLDGGYLCEGSDGAGGKKKILRLNRERFTTLGMDIQPDGILALLTAPDGSILFRRQIPVNKDDLADTIIQAFLSLLGEMMHLKNMPRPSGIGVSITGFIDKEKKTVLASSQIQNFSNIPLSQIIRERYDIPVIVDDSAPLNLICERRFSGGEKSDDIIYVEIGYGVGAGILSNGSLIKGHLGLAGELGHSIVDPNGKRCVCGNHGCLRTVAASTEVITRAADIIRGGTYSMVYELARGCIDKITIDDVLSAAEQNDKVALNIMDETAMYIGIALSNAVNMLNPRELIFGGQMFAHSNYMLEPIRRIISKNILPMFTHEVVYKIGRFIGDGGALGACTVVLNKLLKNLFLSGKCDSDLRRYTPL